MRRPCCAGAARPAAACALLLLLCARASVALDQRTNGVCPSMDIRNSREQLLQLRGCSVIEGQLSITLMERTTVKSFENISFPELREVTGHIIIYRLRGLRNLGDLFPNLTVVRGMSLFKDFAIVVFDNTHLQALGLHSLARIERGSVRIENNDRLCYTNTIDWSRIVADTVDNNIIRGNYDTRLCGLCPNAEGRMEDRRMLQQCSTDAGGRLLCWDDRHCQKLCPSSCGDRACMANGTCCNEACLGGCDGLTAKDCHVCRYFSFGDGKDKLCLRSCPNNTYELFKRCVSEQECRASSVNSEDFPTDPFTKHYYKIFNKACVHTCPSGYMEKGEKQNAICIPCPQNGCYSECEGGKVDSVASAENFRGCTNIKGTLEISLRASGGNTMAELEATLGEIREIEGALKVSRSHPLVSLSFLRNLRVIHGKSPTSAKKQSLYIFNNPNLELLWNWTTHGPIDIKQGKLFIHFNPKLCYDLIEPLRNMTRDNESTFDELEVSQENNGDQATCVQETLNLKVHMLHQRNVILTWNMYCLEDVRKLLGYSIYYIIAEQNITQYDRRDACFDTWTILDIPIEEVQNDTVITTSPNNLLGSACNDIQPLFYPVTQLTPYTRYAAYIKTYTTLQDKKGAQSPIVYFKTLPGKPSSPQSLQVEPLDAHSAYIKWQVPAMPNGSIAMYRIEVQMNSYNRPEIDKINYCSRPGSLASLNTIFKDDSVEKKKYQPSATGDVKDDTCSCADGNRAKGGTRFTSQAEAEQAELIDFENALQNKIYVKIEKSSSKSSSSRTVSRMRRSIDNALVILSNYSNPMPDKKLQNATDEDNYMRTVYLDVRGATHALVKQLRHFSWYTVSVWACREKNAAESQADYDATWCSDRAYDTFKTLERHNADVVTRVRADVLVSNKTLPEVNVTWDAPTNPNGFVIAYNIHHARVEDNSKVSDTGLISCMTSQDYEGSGRSYLLRNLSPGNYSIRVTPVTISGAGNVSAEIFVLIPERTADGSHDWVWGVIGGCLMMLLILVGGIWYAKRSYMPPAEASKLFASVNPEYVSTVYVPDEWEVPRANIELLKELGQGSFGMVYEGIAKGVVKGVPEARCAVKTVNEHATDRERIEFLNEASVMKAFDTYHVVRLMGVVSRGQPTLVVMELMQNGDLKSYLRSHRPDAEGSQPRDKSQPEPVPPTLAQITQMAIEIADGMAYLSAKKFVHRDLAARNCMVAGDLTVKVGDFGMTRDIYETDYYRKGTKGLLPVRWMSPESLKDGVFSSNSDVWSFGVVLWEMATLAMQPYQGLSNEQVLRYVVEGGVMERPEHCPDRLYELMRECWAHRPSCRPSFLQLVADLTPSAAPYFRTRSFFHSPTGQELYAQQRIDVEEEPEVADLNVGAVVTGSGSNLFGVSGRLASWVRELSSVRSRGSDDDAAAEPLAPQQPPPRASASLALALKPTTSGLNGVIRDPASTPC